MIVIGITRPGKTTLTTEVEKGSTVEQALVAAGLQKSDFQSWTFTDEDGDTLTLTSSLNQSTNLICGQRVTGAH